MVTGTQIWIIFYVCSALEEGFTLMTPCYQSRGSIAWNVARMIHTVDSPTELLKHSYGLKHLWHRTRPTANHFIMPMTETWKIRSKIENLSNKRQNNHIQKIQSGDDINNIRKSQPSLVSTVTGSSYCNDCYVNRSN